MKNIYVIPTNKPSRLWINNLLQGKLELEKENLIGSNSAVHIYITNNEEIKEGDWFLDDNNSIDQSYKLSHVQFANPKKIILTTDRELIKDGVQAIDDEFLEWFVENPSCRWVEIEEEDYSQKCKKCGEVVKRGYNCTKGCFMKSGNFIPTDKNINYKIIILRGESKQETLEEAAEKFRSQNPGTMYGGNNTKILNAFKAGVKWMQERMVSKEAYEDSLNMQKTSNVGYESKINELKEKIKTMYSEDDLKDFGKFCSEYDYRCFGKKSQEEMLKIWSDEKK
jgi:hypothetical protein